MSHATRSYPKPKSTANQDLPDTMYRLLRQTFTDNSDPGLTTPLCTIDLPPARGIRLYDPTATPEGPRPHVLQPERIIQHPYPQLLTLLPPLGLKPPAH